jgi:hypothetical protein
LGSADPLFQRIDSGSRQNDNIKSLETQAAKKLATRAGRRSFVPNAKGPDHLPQDCCPAEK